MPAEIVNLRRARKAKARAEREAVAAENRARHGRTKADRQREIEDAKQSDRLLDGHKRQGPSQAGRHSQSKTAPGDDPA